MNARLLLVMLGGALGSGARYLIGATALARLGPNFPWGTLIVNVVGSFAIGLLMELALGAERLGPEARLFLVTGVLGGFTTYSAYNHETLRMIQEGRLGAALLYALGTMALALLAGALGVGGARLWT